jgi:hypothetical protein
MAPLLEMRTRGLEQQRHSLQSLMLGFMTHECADNRDKIYALLGLTYEAGKIEVDYSLSVPQVLWGALETFRFPVEPQKLFQLVRHLDVQHSDLYQYPDFWQRL